MTDAQVERCRKRLEQFLVDLLEPVDGVSGGIGEESMCAACCWMASGNRSSRWPTRLPEGNVQAMQQFIGQSPWEWEPVWERLGERMIKELEPDAVWVIDDTGFPKQGTHSVGVERQYSGTLGKTGNCQIAVSCIMWARRDAPFWVGGCICRRVGPMIAERRAEAGIPEDVSFERNGNWL